MKKGTKALVILVEIIALIGIGAGIFKIHSDKKLEREQQIAAEEAARQLEIEKEQEEQQRELEEQQRREEELSQWNLLLVNEWNAIPDGFEIETAEVENGYVADARIVPALQDMLADCREAGYSPQIISSFRTRETQEYLYNRTANKSDTAIPGHSEHECGLAADIIDAASAGWGDPLIDEQENQPAQKWLMEHCQDYGFILRYPKDKEDITAIIYEPWHYRYVGPEHAKTIMDRGLCLEEYIEQYKEGI